ncbi:hypothetical protein PoB_004718600 [Plakobranchus ocellatus]|uniref:Uncharacterized protein n=1 Tax=Plakobranchus ocellatus TaxID=259542 RepID=A0AAV4BBG3_9GAST|nr:hypothetical protein PoB_004718600 [Plakobranchus ocellatus]
MDGSSGMWTHGQGMLATILYEVFVRVGQVLFSLHHVTAEALSDPRQSSFPDARPARFAQHHVANVGRCHTHRARTPRSKPRCTLTLLELCLAGAIVAV